jgi:NADPH:quinone reductase-like Zn-dependent oxidoreductase
MRAAAIDRFGGPQVVTMHTLPVPDIDPGQVLIAVHTSGLAGWDADIRDGWSPTGRKPRFPLVLGSDGSGTVAGVGSRVRRFKVGDRVYAASFETSGFHAQYIAVDADKVGHVPPGLELKQAGAMPLTGVTALQGVDDALNLGEDETVIVHGAAGGVGTLAVQFAKLRGARVLATATGDDGLALARRLGADEAVDGKRDDIVEAARDFAPDGVDAVLAFAGGEPLRRSGAGSRSLPMTASWACASSGGSIAQSTRRSSGCPSPRPTRSGKPFGPTSGWRRATCSARSCFASVRLD